MSDRAYVPNFLYIFVFDFIYIYASEIYKKNKTQEKKLNWLNGILCVRVFSLLAAVYKQLKTEQWLYVFNRSHAYHADLFPSLFLASVLAFLWFFLRFKYIFAKIEYIFHHIKLISGLFFAFFVAIQNLLGVHTTYIMLLDI